MSFEAARAANEESIGKVFKGAGLMKPIKLAICLLAGVAFATATPAISGGKSGSHGGNTGGSGPPAGFVPSFAYRLAGSAGGDDLWLADSSDSTTYRLASFPEGIFFDLGVPISGENFNGRVAVVQVDNVKFTQPDSLEQLTWDLSSNPVVTGTQTLLALSSTQDHIEDVEYSQDGTKLAVAILHNVNSWNDTDIQIYDVKSGNLLTTIPNQPYVQGQSLTWLPSAAGADDILLWQSLNGDLQTPSLDFDTIVRLDVTQYASDGTGAAEIGSFPQQIGQLMLGRGMDNAPGGVIMSYDDGSTDGSGPKTVTWNLTDHQADGVTPSLVDLPSNGTGYLAGTYPHYDCSESDVINRPWVYSSRHVKYPSIGIYDTSTEAETNLSYGKEGLAEFLPNC